MTGPLPRIEDIGFGWQGHKAAWRLLGAMYGSRNFKRRITQEILASKPQIWALLRGVFAMWVHFWPWAILVSVLGRLALGWLLSVQSHVQTLIIDAAFLTSVGLALGLALGPSLGLAIGYSFGLEKGYERDLFLSLVAGLVAGLVGGLFIGLAGGLAFGLAGGLVGNLALGPVVGLVAGVAFGLAGDLAFSLVVDLVVGLMLGFADGFVYSIAGCLCSYVAYFRLYYLPFHLFSVWFPSHPLFRRWHPVFWDGNCPLHFPSLEVPLVAYAEPLGMKGLAEIEEIIDEMPRQKPVALKALTILLVRKAAKAAALTDAAALLSDLPDGERGYLKQTSEVKVKMLRLADKQRYADAALRPLFREDALHALRSDLSAFRSEVSGYDEPLSSELRKAAEAWLALVDRQLVDTNARLARETTPQVFRAGDPVLRDAEAFVPRMELVSELENEIMTSTGCPGLLIHGRRRLGKSTLLRNLEGFVPESVKVAVVSMQNPEAFESQPKFCALVRDEIGKVYPELLTLGEAAPPDLAAFFGFLNRCNEWLRANARRLIIGIDEFENIDALIGKGSLSEDLLATLRESIQQHRQLTWMLAGSHHFSELPNVRWSNYLVSMRTLDVPIFSRAETHQLLTEPLRHARREQTKAALKSYAAGFWCEGAIDLIHDQAGGWPHLVQLIAAAAVDLCNLRELQVTTPELLTEAVTKAVGTGQTTLSELMLYCSEEYPSAWPYLSAFRTQDTQLPPADDDLRRLLKRHLLVADTPDGQWRLRVPLMQRWLRERM